jgi:hypothetical protein
MATRHGSRRSKAEQWLFGMKWRGTAKETRNTVVPDAKPSNPNTIEKDEGICLEKSRVLGTELSLLSRGRMTLGVGEIFWFISHTLPQCHALQGVEDTYL